MCADDCRERPKELLGFIFFYSFFVRMRKKIVFCVSEKEIDKSEREVCARERAANDKEGGDKERVRERAHYVLSLSLFTL